MDAPLVSIFLAGAPRGKGRPKFSTIAGRPRAITDAATRNYEASLRIAAQHVMGGRDLLTGALDVLIIATMSVPASWSKKRQAEALSGVGRPTTKPDWDNVAKVTDALNGVVWGDDAAIADGTVRKRYGTAPGLLIEVRPAEPF